MEVQLTHILVDPRVLPRALSASRSVSGDAFLCAHRLDRFVVLTIADPRKELLFNPGSKGRAHCRPFMGRAANLGSKASHSFPVPASLVDKGRMKGNGRR